MISALVYVMLHGVPVDAPVVFNHPASFAGDDKCNDYLLSDEFAEQRKSLHDFVAANVVEARSAAAGDTTEFPEVVVTASCIEDNRL